MTQPKSWAKGATFFSFYPYAHDSNAQDVTIFSKGAAAQAGKSHTPRSAPDGLCGATREA